MGEDDFDAMVAILHQYRKGLLTEADMAEAMVMAGLHEWIVEFAMLAREKECRYALPVHAGEAVFH